MPNFDPNKKMTIIRDSREQEGYGWHFEPNEWVQDTVIRKLHAGDYSIEGMEDQIFIERKASTGEFATNCTDPTFEKELERAKNYKYKFLVLEFDSYAVFHFPLNSGIPMRMHGKLKVTSKFMLKKIVEFQIKYGLNVIFAGDYGQDYVLAIFKKIFYDKS